MLNLFLVSIVIIILWLIFGPKDSGPPKILDLTIEKRIVEDPKKGLLVKKKS